MRIHYNSLRDFLARLEGEGELIKIKEKEMNKAVKELDFETAAILRDEIIVLNDKFLGK